MNTFLEIVQALRQEAGIGGSGPTTVVGQTGEYKRLVDWVARAWVEIQELHQTWSFRWARTTLTTDPNQPEPSEYSITPSGVELVDDKSLSIYLQSDGASTRKPLRFMVYQDYMEQYGRYPNTPGAPILATLLPNMYLKLHPDPDDAYVISFDYCRTIQLLAADGDTPLIMEDHRGIILYRALLLYGEHEEAQGVIGTAATEYNQRLNRLRKMCLPHPRLMAEPLA